MKLNPETWGKLRARDVKIIEYVNSSTTKSPEKMIYDMMLRKILPTTLEFGVGMKTDLFSYIIFFIHSDFIFCS